MLGQLTNEQIDHVLHHQIVGRLGCYSDSKMYIVPVTYVYDGEFIYAHSKEGLKIQKMRQNPSVCFEVDIIDNLTNWRSVILWGEYEELNDLAQQQEAMKILMDRLAPLATSETIRSVKGVSRDPQYLDKGLKAVAYKIRVTEKSGRFEKSSN
jgi:uncharacterized protein